MKRGTYKKYDKSNINDVRELYKIYCDQFDKTKAYAQKRSNILTPGLRLRESSKEYKDVEKASFKTFLLALANELLTKDSKESISLVAKRLAKERVLDIDKGLMKSVEHAYQSKNGVSTFLGKETNLTLNQIKDKIRFDTLYRILYFNLVNQKYYEFKQLQGGGKGSSIVAQKMVSQEYFGS